MMASMATAMPAMMSLRIYVLSFVGRADVIGGMPTKTPGANGRYARSRECGELRRGPIGKLNESVRPPGFAGRSTQTEGPGGPRWRHAKQPLDGSPTIRLAL